MSVVYTIDDKIDLKIGSVVVTISPLNYKVKSDMHALVLAGKHMDCAVLGMRHSIKSISGLTNSNGSDYKLKFDESGALADACIDDLLNISESENLSTIALQLMRGMPQGEFTDPLDGKKLKGVSFVKEEKSTSRKK